MFTGAMAVKKIKAKISRKPQGLEILIPAQSHIFVVGFLCFWLTGWAMGEYFAIKSLFFSDQALPLPAVIFMIVWVSLWTVGGIAAITAVLWMLFGRVMVSIDSRYLTITSQVLSLKKSNSVDIQQIKNIRIGPVPTLSATASENSGCPAGDKGGCCQPANAILFDVKEPRQTSRNLRLPGIIPGDKNYFGEHLEEEELKKILSAMKDSGYMKRDAFAPEGRELDESGGDEKYTLPKSFDDF